VSLINLPQFICLAVALFSFPYIPLAIAGWRGGRSAGMSEGSPRIKLLRYWIVEALVSLGVCISYVYLTQIAPFNGFVDGNIFGKGVTAEMEATWEATRCLLCVFGLALGAFLIYRGWHLGRSNTKISNSLFLFGAIAIAYGVCVPTFMAHLVGDIRNAYLFN
jgi:hypothetical protein